MKTSVNILEQIKQIVIGKEPTAKIYLYGSRVRGTSRKDSDWDLLILVNKEKVSYEFEKNLTDSLYDLEFDSGEVISPMIYSEQEWNTKYSVTPFYHFVMKEAKPL
ncbi:MAG: nucleotidyltransferase domain-containing protein [Bacteroidales bacterium]